MPLTTLNFIPATFSAQTIAGFAVDYIGSEHLKQLQDTYSGQYLFRRDYSRNKIIAISLVQSAPQLPGKTENEQLSIVRDYHLFSGLLEEGIRRFLRARNPSIPQFGRIYVRVERESEDVFPVAVRRALKSDNDARLAVDKLRFLRIFRRYFIEGAYVGITEEEVSPQYGLLFDIGTAWQIKATLQELVMAGVDVTGCYATPSTSPVNATEIGHKSVGRVSKLEGDVVYLSDYRDKETISAKTHQIEASLDNFTLCIRSLLSEDAASDILREIRRGVHDVTSAVAQQERIRSLAEALRKEPIQCAVGLTAQLSNGLFDASLHPTAKVYLMSAPSYSLGYAKSPVTTSIASAIAKDGPFDQDSFGRVIPNILVITPKSCQGAVEQFIRKWKDGIPNSPYAKGFVAQYRLRGCEFRVEAVEDGAHAADEYINACNRAISYSQENLKRFDLAFVVVEERHRLLGRNDPYLVTKAALMGREIPVQVIEIETIRSNQKSLPFIMNNLALACYAKLGGTPWALASAHGQGITHEVIVGLGSVIISDGRYQEKERYVGITTLFNYDGVYLLSNVSEDVGYAQYPEALQRTLLNSIQYVSIKKGWQRGDKVRLIFHTFKPLKHTEMEDIKLTVTNALSDFSVDFAFLTISQHHRWRMYSPGFPGVPSRVGSTLKGKNVPLRGTTVIVGRRKSLLAMTGPSEVKTSEQGCPQPVQMTLHGSSTFADIEYLTRQVFEFTYMSWKTYNNSAMPVTIQYSELIAELLGRLRQVRNWNANVLQSGNLKSSLWFL
ncbi:MAG: hypothetical protein J0M33_02880 [Anaerolineae bacterium]|nr:hypothetical protein [Anaerolineae bacterium]